MKFLWWVGFIWILLLTAISIASLQGQSEANKLAKFGLGVCEGKPCYRGIVPGVTLWDDVRSHLSGANLSVDESRTIAVTLTDKIQIVINRDADNLPMAGIIRISDYIIIDIMPTDFPSLGLFLLTYGTPCLVIVDTSNPTRTRIHVTQLTYPTLAINLYSTEPFSPTVRVKDAWIFNAGPDLCTAEFNKSIGVSWAGFAQQATYFKALMDEPLMHFE